MYIAVQSAEEILENVEGDAQIIAECENALLKLQKQPCSDTDNKQAAALLCFAGLADAKNMNKRVFSCDPLKKISAFLGYYVLNARGMAGDIKGAVELIRGYWGAMLDLGSSTFWEDFDIEWIKGAKPIDSILKEGEYDVHGDNGGYCYKGYRHSLCHGWASGPVPFISEYVLGIQPVEPGFGKVRICPELGDLEWIEGCCPTPFGNIEIRCERIDGIPTITKLSVPKEILVEKTTLKLCC